jgi:uncharacterized membrane protein
MRGVNISQLWGRAWDLFKVNGLLFVVLLVSLPTIIVILIPIYLLWPIFVSLALMPVLVRAGYLVARQGQPSFVEVFRGLSSLLKIFVYELTLLLILWILLRIAPPGWDVLDILLVGGLIILFLSFFVWAAPYYVLSGRAGIFSAIGQSFSLTWRNFSKVFVALLSVIGLLILGLLFLGLGLLMEVPILILGGVLLCGLGLLVVLSIGSIFLPLLYFALTGEEGVSHSKSLRLG